MRQVVGDLHLKSLATYAGSHQMAVDNSPGGRHLAQEVMSPETHTVLVCRHTLHPTPYTPRPKP